MGLEEREQLATQIQSLYKTKSIPLQIAGLELALRAHARWEKRFDQGLLTWEQLKEQRGKTNGMVVGIARALHENNGWTLQALQMWKTHQSPYWTIIEEPVFIREKLQPFIAKAIPSIVASNMTLNIFHKTIVSYQQQSEPTKKSAAKATLDKLFQGMLKTPLEEKARDLLFLCSESLEPRYGWLNQLKDERVQPAVAPTSAPKVSTLRKATNTDIEDVEFRDLAPEDPNSMDFDLEGDLVAALQQNDIAPAAKAGGLRKSSLSRGSDGPDFADLEALGDAVNIATTISPTISSPSPSATPRKGGLRKASAADNPELEIGLAQDQQDDIADLLDVSTTDLGRLQKTNTLAATRETGISADDAAFLASMEL